MNNKHVQWMFVDMNSFFASVEQQENPMLAGQPVAVVPSMTEHTCAIAASYEAKSYGIKTGIIIRDALDLCPHLHCVPARHDVYVDYHHRILEEAVKHTPLTKVWSVDEFSSRLTPDNQSVDCAIAISNRLKVGLAQNVGEHVKCSVGLAPNAYLAKVATDMQKPDGLVVLTPDILQDALFPLRLTDFPGIGENIQRRLNKGGIWTVEHLWNTQPKQLRKIWGSVEGEKFWYKLRGHYVPDQDHNKVMVGHSRVLDPAHRSPDMAKQIARRLTVKAAQRLRRYGMGAGAFRLSVTTTEREKWGVDVRLDHVDDNLSFIQTLNHLWGRMMHEFKPWRLKKVSVIMHNLRKPETVTADLFSISTTRQHQRRVAAELSAGMDALNKKYGANTCHFGACPSTLAGYVGTKIAFSRIPDQAEFWE
jgi:DNA polymerase-4